MRISTKGRYALRLMIDLAEQSQDVFTALKDVSRRQDISVKYLEQIITQLNRAGLVKSSRGPQGGYRLTKELRQYRIGDILRVTEGKLAPVACLEDEENACGRAASCPTLPIWEELHKRINDYVDSVTLADLVSQTADFVEK